MLLCFTVVVLGAYVRLTSDLTPLGAAHGITRGTTPAATPALHTDGPLVHVAIHLAHGLGEVITSLALVGSALLVLRRQKQPAARHMAWALLAALCLQLLIGSSMVLNALPLWLATAHIAGAALLLLAALALLRSVSAH